MNPTTFFGEGNNGRDCIQVPLGGFSTVQFDHDLTNCFFQNDKVGYDIGQYLNGMIRTSGIARFVDKFTVLFNQATIGGLPSYTFQLTPKPTADFRFYIAQQPSICPTVVGRPVVSASGCRVTFFYTGNQTVTFGGTTLTFSNSSAVGFVNTASTPYVLTAGGTSCLSINCQQTVNSTYVLLQTPSFSVISQDDLNLAAATLPLDTIMNNSLDLLNAIEQNATDSEAKINQILGLLASIDYNVSELFPYQNWTNLRNQVDGVVSNINAKYCNSPFDSIQCWLKSSASIIVAGIVIGIVVVVIVIILVKTGYAKRLKNKLLPELEDNDEAKTPDEKCETPGTPKKSDSADFQLLATN